MPRGAGSAGLGVFGGLGVQARDPPRDACGATSSVTGHSRYPVFAVWRRDGRTRHGCLTNISPVGAKCAGKLPEISNRGRLWAGTTTHTARRGGRRADWHNHRVARPFAKGSLDTLNQSGMRATAGGCASPLSGDQQTDGLAQFLMITLDRRCSEVRVRTLNRKRSAPGALVVTRARSNVCGLCAAPSSSPSLSWSRRLAWSRLRAAFSAALLIAGRQAR
jgi:hypothetical protein